MKNSIKTLVAIAILAIASNVFAQGTTATADGVIKTCTICPISIVHDPLANLNFGTLIITDLVNPQTVTVDPVATMPTTYSNSAGVTLYHGSMAHSEPTADHFTVTGTASYQFVTYVPNWSNTNPLVLPGGRGTVLLSNSFGVSPTNSLFPALTEGTMGCVNMELYVGGTYTIPAGTPPGETTTGYTVQVQYN